ncbi:MAG: hypothetical protein IAF94_08440 [Pirellulaceae bacterium]|nr:hypothetical protein [Pirellulaceae bacterium]
MHTIRLRGPWEIYLPGSEQPRRMEMQATWHTLLALPADDTPLPSPPRLVRRFGLPTGIAEGDRLHLVLESAAACQVELNGHQLGSIAVAQQCSSFDVTQLLKARNELVILLEIPPREIRQAESSCPVSDVRLEIASAPPTPA